MPKLSALLAAAAAPSEPVPVYTGPTKTGAALIAAVAVDAEKQTTRPRGKKSRVATKKPDTADEDAGQDAGKNAKSDAKSDTKRAAKPAAVRHANAKPAAAPKAGENPETPGDKPAAKPAKPKAVAKPAIKPKRTTEAKPAEQQTTAAPRG